ncbi:MAG TPA: sensor histidine kinase [Candidatus Limnocylindrales bacterium]|nr:sensor histidine kinase [Candidatus Limnocylindrales bacterium]
MTSEAGRRPLRARLATSGTAKQPKAGRRKPPVDGAGSRATEAPTVGTNGHAKGLDPADPELNVIAPAAPPSSGQSRGRGATPNDDPLAALLAEAQAAVSDGANALRDVRERYRAAYNERVEQLEAMRAWPTPAVGPLAARAAANAKSSAEKAGKHGDTVSGHDVGMERDALNRIDLAAKSLENAWLFLAREDASLVSDPSGPPSAADAQMRIVEAQEQERTRLAREVHDGPAQALSNAIFQVEVVQRLLDRDEQAARDELQQLREVLTRELRGVRAYLSQLRPPLLADLGLSGAIKEAAAQTEAALNIPVTVELAEHIDNLPETVEVVALRVIQEALQNARKHAQPSSIRVRVSKDGNAWAVEVRDDGKGFDANDPPLSGRRHFGLQFMRERAELIGARFEVRSSPNLGTAVRMTIPPGAMGMPIPEGEV